MSRPNLYTITPGAPFLETLARAILEGALPHAGGQPPDRLELSRWTILLPTRRAVRALGDAFMQVSGDTALLLPQIRPLGDVEEDALALSPMTEITGMGETALGLPPAIGNLERRLALTKLVLGWSQALAASDGDEGFRQAATPAQASSLARELAALMDTLDTEQVAFKNLDELVPDRFADHWQQTIGFLKIVTEAWPEHLTENNVMAPYDRRNRLMEEEAKRLKQSPPPVPVIAAGSTGTMPTTAELLEVIASLPLGAVILPGLDTHLDEESWQSISKPEPHPEHPQYGMRQFLDRLGVPRDEVALLGGDTDLRSELVSEVMRPSTTTQNWSQLSEKFAGKDVAGSFDGIHRIDAPSEQDEAEVISLLLRHAVETPGRTAALVTPDRTLSRRVSARLEKWGLAVDDSAGRPLDKTLPGSFMDALADTAGAGFSPLSLLALLKHPLALLGRRPGEMRRVARLLELTAFRQPALTNGLKAHREAAKRMFARLDKGERVHSSVKRMTAKDRDAVFTLLDDIEIAVEPMMRLMTGPNDTLELHTVIDAHAEAGERLACNDEGSSAALWQNDAGEALADVFAALLSAEGSAFPIAFGDYLELYRSFIAGTPVRRRTPSHPRIHIWGPLEARLQRPDMVILGGLNEGVWPASIDAGPWLSRPMRTDLGLSALERGIGLSAHDVSQLLGVEEVWLTRAEKSGGAPSVPSRWLLRFDAVLDALGQGGSIRADEDWLGWARARDSIEPMPSIPAPSPKPPVSARPTGLSVTRIEDWIANPYAIFARDILRLHKLDDLAGDPGPALKGTLVHDALQRFAQAHPGKLPQDIASELMRVARELFGQFGDGARIETFWQGQFAVFAKWFAATEPARRAGVARVHCEVPGEMTLDQASGFTLSARADRIDEREDGQLAIYDYKTGGLPSPKQVSDGKSPQLPLEAAIAVAGGFSKLEAVPVSMLAYISARGYGEGGKEVNVSEKTSPGELAEDAIAQLADLVKAYSDEARGYTAMRRANFSNANQYRYDDYAHLARVLEWQAGPGGEGQS